MAVPVALTLMAGSAAAQQAMYYPDMNSAVTVNYGALSPYGQQGYQPYAGQTYAGQTYAGQPQSVFTPQGAAVYGQPAPSSQFMPGASVAPAAPIAVPVQAAPVALAGPGYGGRAYSPITYTASPIQAPFVAPYANPALQQPQMTAGGLPTSTPQSYLNVPGQAPVALLGTPQAGAKPFDPNSQKRKAKKQAPAPSAVEEAAAAQVAAVEEQLESGAAAAPLPEPTPPAAPADVPASVPSPVQEAAVAPAPAAPAAEAPAAETPSEPATTEAPAEAPAAEAPAAADAAPAEEAPAAEEQPAEEASAEGGAAAALPGGATRIVFEGEADELPAGASAQLDTIAQQMSADESIKVQVLAYSSASGDNESQARRKALSRGLEVRKYLINKGVRSNRIDVRALGSKSEGSPADRVDVVPAAG